MTHRNTYLELRRGVNRKRQACTDPNLAVRLETLSVNLLNLASDSSDPDLLAQLPANVRAIESYSRNAPEKIEQVQRLRLQHRETL